MNMLGLTILMILMAALLESPLFTVIAALSIACLFFASHEFSSLQMIIIEMNRLASMPVLVALPLFTFAGCLLTETNAPRRILNLLQAVLGRVPGGLAIAALGSCAFFTALTGASGVTIVAIGGLLYPILRKRRYGEKFSLGLLTTSGSLGLLFPPSLPIILYGVVARTDINMIFKAALIPGILLIGVLSFYVFFREKYFARSFPEESRCIISEKGEPEVGFRQAFLEGVWEWPALIIIIWGVYGGFVTIAEVSAVTLGYLFIVECFILKEVHWLRQIPGIMIDSAKLSGAIIIILAVSLGFTGYLVDEQIPGRVLSFLTGITDDKYVFLAGLNLFLLAVGCMMDIFSAIIIIVPIMVPVALSYGIDPVHLCIIFLVNLEIGYSTPPVGINLFISAIRFKKPVTVLYQASLPYLALLLLTLVVVTYVPVLSLMLIR